MKVLSLFANIGVAEAYFKDIGFKTVLANESITRRAKLFSDIYPDAKMICGDFNDIDIFNSLVSESIDLGVEIVMATPPCQGMSTAGQQKTGDERNNLIISTIDLIEKVNPKFIFIENVPLFLKTYISFNGVDILIPDLIRSRLGSKYNINFNIIDTKNYSVPQSRQRTIILLTRKDQNFIWSIPDENSKVVSLKQAIGKIPIIDPFVKDISEEELLCLFPNFHKRREKALKISKWNNPPIHIKRQVITMMNTPTGKSAFENVDFKPVKENGELIKGFKNTYKRQDWDSPAFTVTMDNRKISSQNNVHPGRRLDGGIFSDARTLTLYEIMKVMSLPDDWPLPSNASEAFVRRVIGEGIPPFFVKQVFEKLLKND
jgi:DNA (cytosine-5)-methyltransferase 1